MSYTTIDNPELYFQTKAYTGTGSSHAVTLDGSEDMQPDWVWIKARSASRNHKLYDSVRGVTKTIGSNESDAEATVATSLTAFGSDGFTVSSDVSVNESSETFVAWNWKAGTSFTNDASATSVGTIDSTGSVSTDAGFSIVSFTGTGSAGTIKHGLSVAPSMVIIKNRDDGQSWRVGVTSIGFDKYLGLNGTGASTSSSGMFNNTAPTSSVFSVGTDGATNASGEKCIAYCFADVKGYSKIGSYTGNGNADGTFVYTGFKPAFILTKNTGSGHDWWVLDNKRDIYNATNGRLRASSNGAEDSAGNSHDFLSNGFKLRTGSSGDVNESGATMIYLAFAESPFVNSNGIPNNAR